MKRQRKKYKRPKILWSKERIEREKGLSRAFGLRRNMEVWKTETLLRKYRRLARKLATMRNEKTEKDLVRRLADLGILKETASLDDVLGLTVKDILERRLQTRVHRLGLANTPMHSRQLIVHGHVLVGGRKITYPSYMVSKEEEGQIKVLPQKERMRAESGEKSGEKKEAEKDGKSG